MPEVLPRVHACGVPSEATFGAEAFVVRSRGGNVLVDVPEFTPEVVADLEAMEGLAYIFLTHRDDVGEACAFRERFAAPIVIHATEVRAVPCPVAVPVHGDMRLTEDVEIIHTPGHSPGSCCLLFHEGPGVLFVGDHLGGSSDGSLLPRRFPWTWDWEAQIRSTQKLLAFPFEVVIMAHGRRAGQVITDARERLRRGVAALRGKTPAA